MTARINAAQPEPASVPPKPAGLGQVFRLFAERGRAVRQQLRPNPRLFADALERLAAKYGWDTAPVELDDKAAGVRPATV